MLIDINYQFIQSGIVIAYVTTVDDHDIFQLQQVHIVTVWVGGTHSGQVYAKKSEKTLCTSDKSVHN